MTELKRITKAGFIGFKRNGLVSWAAVLNITTTLSVIISIILLQAVLHYALIQIKDKVDVTIYFTVGVPEDQILQLKSSLEKLPEIASISYTSAEDALKIFRDRHASDYPTIQALDEIKDNPLGAYLNVKTKEISQYEGIANFLKSDDSLVLGSASIIDKVNYRQNKPVIDRLNAIISGAQKLSLILTLVLIAMCLINTFNTIRLIILISKEEIGVMRLVGASKMQVQGPFMIEGAIYGVVATLVSMFLFWPISTWFGNNMTDFFGLNLSDYYFANLLEIFIIILLSGVFLGMVSSFLAARKYLNK